MKEKKERCEVMTWIVLGSVLTVAGILVIPPLVKSTEPSCTRNHYKQMKLTLTKWGQK